VVQGVGFTTAPTGHRANSISRTSQRRAVKLSFVWASAVQKPKPAAISENMRSVPRVYRPPYRDQSSEVTSASRPTIQIIIGMALRSDSHGRWRIGNQGGLNSARLPKVGARAAIGQNFALQIVTRFPELP
jgi:hypothetical protein